MTSSLDSNFYPANDFFKFGNKKKSYGATSGEYGGWGIKQFVVKFDQFGHDDDGVVSRSVVMVKSTNGAVVSAIKR